jgi:TIR domain
MPDVFISYKRERRAAAQHVAKILTIYGYDVWFDYALVKGRDFGLQLDAQIRSSKVLLVLWCKRSVGSRWVHEEVDLAQELGILLPVKIEPCELPVGNRRVDYIDLASWDGSPRSTQLDDLIEEIGKRLGREPAPGFLALKDYESLWRQFGALPMSAFALDESRAVAARKEDPSAAGDHLKPSMQVNGEGEPRDLSVLQAIWTELKSTDSLDRLGRFLEQVRGTALDVAVEERIAKLERASTTVKTADWLREARPILEQVKALYDSMGWKQYGPKPDPRRFENNLRLLIESLPPLPDDTDVVHVANVLDEYLNVKLHHGLPIPDDYTLESVFPLPNSRWGDSLQRVKACRRPGVHSRRYDREGFGEIGEGLLVQPVVDLKD